MGWTKLQCILIHSMNYKQSIVSYYAWGLGLKSLITENDESGDPTKHLRAHFAKTMTLPQQP